MHITDKLHTLKFQHFHFHHEGYGTQTVQPPFLLSHGILCYREINSTLLTVLYQTKCRLNAKSMKVEISDALYQDESFLYITLYFHTAEQVMLHKLSGNDPSEVMWDVKTDLGLANSL